MICALESPGEPRGDIPVGSNQPRMTPGRENQFHACFTADVEQDCPPYLQTCHGMTEGLPRLLDLLAALRIQGTFFTTGEMARKFPAVIRRLVEDGHELACHGDSHRDFTKLSVDETRAELRGSLATLREFAPVVSFRAPYLRFPPAYLPLLVEQGLRVDSSIARYKRGANHRDDCAIPGLTRVPASLTSSALRLPRAIRTPWISALKKPLMLFVHPWEAVDFRRSTLRWDCRFRTGEPALRQWRSVLSDLRQRGARFVPLVKLAGLKTVAAGA
jgi:peptidoglycan/xylan/chitin deacetylase (PgdA/CDA1 family)